MDELAAFLHSTHFRTRQRGVLPPYSTISFDMSVVSNSDNQLSTVLYRCREGLIAVGLLSMAVNLLALTASVYMLQVYDRALPGRSVATLIYLTVIAGGALAAMAAFDVLPSRILARLGVWIDRCCRPRSSGARSKTTLRGLPTGASILAMAFRFTRCSQ